MNRIFYSILFIFGLNLFVAAQSETEKNIQISLISLLGSNGSQARSTINKLSLNLLGGYSYGNTIFELGGLYNVNSNLTRGVQVAGIANYSGKTEKAIQIAGITNIAKAGITATQFSGIANIASETNGFQFSGITNISKRINGVQFSGIANIAKEVNGVQLSGILNLANKINGVQLALINIANESNGVSVGLINIIKKNGKQEFEIAFSEALNTAVNFKLGTNDFYTIFSGGVNYFEKTVQYAAGMGFGTQMCWKKGWCNEIELMGYALTENKSFSLDGINMLTQIKLPVSYQFANHFKVFAGPTLNMTISKYINPETGKLGSSLSPYSLWQNKSESVKLNGWIGFSAGVRF